MSKFHVDGAEQANERPPKVVSPNRRVLVCKSRLSFTVPYCHAVETFVVVDAVRI